MIAKTMSRPVNQREWTTEATHQAPGAVQRLRILPGAQHLQPAKRSARGAWHRKSLISSEKATEMRLKRTITV